VEEVEVISTCGCPCASGACGSFQKVGGCLDVHDSGAEFRLASTAALPHLLKSSLSALLSTSLIYFFGVNK
jgi:hypothetical protein